MVALRVVVNVMKPREILIAYIFNKERKNNNREEWKHPDELDLV